MVTSESPGASCGTSGAPFFALDEPEPGKTQLEAGKDEAVQLEEDKDLITYEVPEGYM